MNLFGRFILIFFTLLAMAISLMLLTQLFYLVSPQQIGLPTWLTEQILALVNSNRKTRLISAGISFGVFLTGTVLLFIELRPFFLGEPRVLVFKDDLGKVEIAESCIGKFINYEARTFAEISAAKSKILIKKNELYIKSRITINPETKTAELEQKLQKSLEEKLKNDLGLVASGINIIAEVKQEPDLLERTLK